MLHLIGGIEPPTSGEILFQDKLLSAMDDDQRSLVRRRSFGFVFQRINLLPTLTAVENVALPLLIDNEPRASAIQKALERPGNAGGRAPQQASSQRDVGRRTTTRGDRRALVIEPALILADEPTGGLDRVTGQKIVAELRACVDAGRAVVVVTHDPEIAEQADRRIVVCDGLIQPPARSAKAKADAMEGRESQFRQAGKPEHFARRRPTSLPEPP